MNHGSNHTQIHAHTCMRINHDLRSLPDQSKLGEGKIGKQIEC